jgi:Family of unknown function (DUF5947)
MGEAAWLADSSLATLKRLRARRPADERCELCALPLESRHAHLLEPTERRILCSCEPCAILFQDGSGRYRRVPRDVFVLGGFEMPELVWESLSIPINLAFFFYSSASHKIVACYPSPGGAIEALLELSAWHEIAAVHRRLQHIPPDVEAFLVNRLATPPEYYVVPIDRCYELAGLVRKHWKGFNGGDEVWREIKAFFATLRAEAIQLGGNRA